MAEHVSNIYFNILFLMVGLGTVKCKLCDN